MGIYISVSSPAFNPTGYKVLFKLTCYPLELEGLKIASNEAMESKTLIDWLEWLSRALMLCARDPVPFQKDGIGSPYEILYDLKEVVDAITIIGSQPHKLSWG